MKSIKKFFTIFSVVLFSCVNIQSVMALSKDDIGTTTAQFLKLGIGAQSAGMGNAVTCVANGTDSIYSNPANLNYLEKIENLIHDESFIDYFKNHFLGSRR